MTIEKGRALFRRAARAFAVCVSLTVASIAALAFDLQGHRGARGLAPENTLAGFAKALEVGVATLETDLAVTRDGIIVLSHDSRLNPEITRGPDGAWLVPPTSPIQALTLAQLRTYDVGRLKPGSKYAAQFSTQQPIDGQRVPTLTELFELATASGKAPRFNLETKLSPDLPQEAPAPKVFAQLVVEAVRKAGLSNRTSLQSFDWRTLLESRALAPEIETVCLTTASTLKDRVNDDKRSPSPWLGGLDPASFGNSVPRLVQAAGCRTWSPRFVELSAELVSQAHALGLKVVPWTVNDPADMERLIDMTVDGLITDYPDRVRTVLAAKGLSLSP